MGKRQARQFRYN